MRAADMAHSLRDSLQRQPGFSGRFARLEHRVFGLAGRLAMLACVVLLLSTSHSSGLALIIHVPADYETISAALENAPDDAIVEVAEGNYRESLVIERPLTLRSKEGVTVLLSGSDDEPVIQISDTENVLIEDLTISGGKFGIFVTRSLNITIRNNVISDSRLVGIKVRLGSADIRNNTIRDANAPYGRGIHITNTTQWAASHVIGNTVSGNALSGIVTNMTGMIYIEDNIVTDNQQHGISIDEMSHALVADNIVDRNAETGIYVFDMSMASICGNVVRNTLAAVAGAGLRFGNGILIDFHSMAEVHNNIVIDNANHGIQMLFDSRIVASSNDLKRNGSDILPKYTDLNSGHGC